MSNYLPEDAIIIPSLPYSTAQDVSGAPEGASYHSTCVPSHPYYAVWYAYTPIENETYLAVTAFASDNSGNYVPKISIWTGTPPSLTQFQIDGSSGGGDIQPFCGTLSDHTWFLIPTVPGTKYYFQITDANNTTPLGSSLTFKLRANPYSDVPVGSLVITDDTSGFPATVISATTGDILRYVDIAAGEVTAVLPTGEICTQNGTVSNGEKAVVIYDGQLNIVATHSFSPGLVKGVSCDFDSTFYVVVSTSGTYTVTAISKTGSVGATRTLAHIATCGTVNRDGTVFYYGTTNLATGIIYAWDLVNNIALPNLHAGFGTEALVGLGTGYVDPDGTIWFAYAKDSTGETPKLRGFDSSGTLLHTFLLADGNMQFINRWCGVDNVVWVWGHLTFGAALAYIKRYALSNGAVLTSLPAIQEAVVSGLMSQSVTEPYGISNSCPIFALAEALTVSTTGIPLSGLYVLVPGKTNDTVYTAFDPVDEIIVKIPDPFASGYLAGDE